jgi:uncharacterized protein (DUF58 family)
VIIPSYRILKLIGFTLLPAGLLSAMRPDLVPELLLVPLLLCLVIIPDGVSAWNRRRGLSIIFPERINLTVGRSGAISFVLKGGKPRALRLQIGIPLPAGFSIPENQSQLSFPAGAEAIRTDWTITGTKRGLFELSRCHLRVDSPLGLWQAQTTLPISSELRVYPTLQNERRKLAALFLNRNDRQIRPQRQRGQGREFEKLRLYMPGDSLGDIHWKATAKRGQLVTKEFQIERTQEVYAILDVSRLSACPVTAEGGVGTEPLLERAIRTTLVLGAVAERQGDLFGTLAFGEQVQGFVRAKSGKQHFGHCRDMLYRLQPESGNPGFEEAASFLAARLRRRALLIFMTSLDEPALSEAFVRSIKILSRRHLVCVAMQRPVEAEPLFSGQPVSNLPQVYGRLGGHLVWHQLKELQQSLRLQGVQLFLVENERLSADVISHYLDIKRRQLL